MSVVITNASSVKALAVARSLGRKGIPVSAVDSVSTSPTFYSRYVQTHFLTPNAEKHPIEFIKSLLSFVKKVKPRSLFPINSTETLLVSKFKEKFEDVTLVPFESYEKMLVLHEKDKFVKLSEDLGFPVPKTYTIEDIAELRKISEKVNYPVVIKLVSATSSKGLSYAHSEEELILKYKQTVEKYRLKKGEYPIIQEYIPGEGYGVSVLMNHGDLRAIFTHKRLREYPITGGPSSLRISVRHPKMEKIAVDLLKELEWHGLAMVEFKLDNRNNEPVLIETNPRFWGSINHAIVSGVDFPYLLYKMAINGDVERVTNYKLGVVTMYLMNDLRAVFSAILNGKFHLLTKTFKVDAIDEISRDDPVPALVFPYMELKNIVRAIFNRRG